MACLARITVSEVKVLIEYLSDNGWVGLAGYDIHLWHETCKSGLLKPNT